MSVHLQKFASIQPRTSLVKFATALSPLSPLSSRPLEGAPLREGPRLLPAGGGRRRGRRAPADAAPGAPYQSICNFAEI